MTRDTGTMRACAPYAKDDDAGKEGHNKKTRRRRNRRRKAGRKGSDEGEEKQDVGGECKKEEVEGDDKIGMEESAEPVSESASSNARTEVLPRTFLALAAQYGRKEFKTPYAEEHNHTPGTPKARESAGRAALSDFRHRFFCAAQARISEKQLRTLGRAVAEARELARASSGGGRGLKELLGEEAEEEAQGNWSDY